MTNPQKKGGYFIKGDISGIQEFIFNVKSEKAARVLNARSAYIQMYTNIVNQYIQRELEREGNVKKFSEGGGSFFLFLEDCKKSLQDIKGIIKKIEKEANSKGMIDDLYVVLSVVEYNNKEEFSYWNAITKSSNKDKLQKYAIAGSEPEDNDPIKNQNPFTPFRLKEENYDWISFAHERVKRETWEQVLKVEEAQETKTFEDGIISLYKAFHMPERVPSNFRGGFYKDKIQDKLPEWEPPLRSAYLNEIEQELKKRNSGIVDKKKEEIRPYDIIDYYFLSYFAKERTGTEKLGILKMDVDSLGDFFIQQTRQTEAERVSKAIRTFFEEVLYKLLQKKIKFSYQDSNRTSNPNRYKDNIYTVFAGGDDCFFVGGWDVILEWAALVREEFKAYTKKEQLKYPKKDIYLTLSAGVVIVGAKFPVIRFAELANDAISNAKSSQRNEPKNKICLFDQVLTWDEFTKARNWAEKLKVLIENDEKKSTLERIKRSSIGFEKLQDKAIDGEISAPKTANLFYYIRRNTTEKNVETLEDLVQEYTDALIAAFVENRKQFSSQKNERDELQEMDVIKTNPMLLPIAARWAEFLTRKDIKSNNNGKG